MQITIKYSKELLHSVSEKILGQQLEAWEVTIDGLLSERLKNPKFTAPGDPRTGIAHKWRPTFSTTPGIHYELTPGLSMSGYESQLCHSYWPATKLAGIRQNNCQIKAGEVLEVEIWAKAMSEPVAIKVALQPNSAQAPDYAAANINIESSYWKQYRAQLTIPSDDKEAVFYIKIEGGGKVWFDQVHLRPIDEPILCSEIINNFASLQIPVLRFPGGTISNNYHWFHGTGPNHLRPVLPDPVFKGKMCYEFGIDEYLELCNSQNITPHITINIGSGTVDEAEEWAAYCKKWFTERNIELPVIYFEVGNEQDGHHELGHTYPELYIKVLEEFVPLIRQAYPKSRIIAIIPDNYYYLYDHQEKPWRKEILDKAHHLADIFSIHSYKGQWNETDEKRQINVVDSIGKVNNRLNKLIQDLKERGLSHKIALTEWNYWLHAGQTDGIGFYEPYDIQHAMFVSGMISMLARLGEYIELANFYHLINPMGVFYHQGTTIQQSCLADIFRLFRPALPGILIALENSSPLLGKNELIVDSLAIRKENTLWLFLTNRSFNTDVEIKLEHFWEGNTIEEIILLAGNSPTEQFSEQTAVVVDNRLNLPRLSICRLKFQSDHLPGKNNAR